MATIKGITIEIGGDTTGLDKALKGVNSEISSTQKELKDVEKALKLDPSNVELLEQKQKALATSVEATTKKLDTLKEAQRQMEEAGITDENRAQYEALQREIVKTEAALKDAKTAQDNFNVSIESAKAKLSAVGDAASTVSQKTKGLSTAAAGLVGGITALGMKSLETADDLMTLSQQTGISTDELQKMQYASEMVDVDVSVMTGSLAKMKKQLSTVSGEEKFTALGIATRDANGAFRETTDIFYDVLGALSQIPNETERDLVAMDIFGKSADSLAGIIDDGGASLKEYGAQAESLGLIMSEETLTGLNDVKTKIDELKAQGAAQLAETGAKAIEALTPVIETLVEKLSELFNWLGSLSTEQLETILIIGAVVAAISPIAGIIAGICGAINSFLTLWPAVKTAAIAIKAFAAANPLVLIATAVVALVVLIATHWEQVKEILAKVKEKVLEVINTLKDKINTFKEAAAASFQQIHDNIKEKVQAVIDTFTRLKDKAKEILDKIKTFFSDIWNGILSTVTDVVNKLIGKVNGAIDGINTLTQAANNSLLGKALGLNIGKIGNVPMLAEGGVLSSGSAIVGERGAELLSMKNGKAEVQPLTNNYSTTNYMTSQQPLEISISLDGQILAQQLVNPLSRAQALAGASNIR